MNILRLVIVVAVVFMFSGCLSASEKSTELIVPDLLSDGFLDGKQIGGFDEENQFVISDPFEPMNRVFFEFNDVVYVWALKPITDGYIRVVPREMRLTFSNFFFNLAMPIRLLNTLLQGDFEGAGLVLGRFTINTTLGIYGLADVAAVEFDIQPRRADFGQTLGKWGVGEGIYFCWPIFGPSSMRDSFGIVVDAYTHPIPYFHESRTLDTAYYLSERINTLSLNPDIYEDLKRFSLDPYVASRHAFIQYRRAFIEKE